MNKAAEIQKLKKLALVRYEQDGGTMFECSDEQDYIDAIEDSRTAAKAWKYHLRIHEIRKEYYEQF
jgi:hypothetical protein